MGNNMISEAECTSFGGCFSDSKCFYDQTFIPGFLHYKGSGSFTTFYDIHSSISLEDCSRKCLSNNNCNCFSYDFTGTVCKLTIEHCQVGVPGSNDQFYVYERNAFNTFTCYHTNCGHTDQHSHSNITSCYQHCLNQPSCLLFTFMMDSRSTKCTIIENLSCDLFGISGRSDPEIVSCVPGPIFQSVNNRNDQKLQNITDNEIDDTCISVTLENRFSLRIPWPSVGKVIPDFQIKVIGKNMQKCINVNEDVEMKYGVLAYVPTGKQRDPKFREIFTGCNLSEGDDSTNCVFNCTCGLDYCQAVYVKAFGESNYNMQICHYEIN